MTPRNWKACWGQPLTSSNLVSSATPRSRETAGQRLVSPSERTKQNRGGSQSGSCPGVVPSQFPSRFFLGRGKATRRTVVWLVIFGQGYVASGRTEVVPRRASGELFQYDPMHPGSVELPHDWPKV
jgi:hypothetical protein